MQAGGSRGHVDTEGADLTKALIVGAGAVGQVFGYHLHLSGAEVTFGVRDPGAAGLRPGLNLYPLHRRRARERPTEFEAFGVTSLHGAADGKAWDQIYLCVPSEALQGGLLASLSRLVGKATVVSVQPGMEDQRLVSQYIPGGQLVSGMVSFLSYSAPLPGESVPRPGIVYWFPPLVPSPFSGESTRVAWVVDALRAGGFPARKHQDVPSLRSYLVALQTCLTSGLARTEWSFERLRRSPLLTLGHRALREATPIVGHYQGSKPPTLLRAVRPWTIRLALSIAARLRPVDLQQFFAYHYTKLHGQTVHLLNTYIVQGRQMGLGTAALEELLGAVAEPQSPRPG